MAPQPESPNFHERLGVDADASKEEINQAFRTLAKEHHPEAGGDTETFQRLSEAKTALVPPENRGAGEGEMASAEETETRITELKKELKEEETERTPETKLAPPGGEPPEEEGDGGGGGGGGRSGGSQEWGMEYAPCPTCYKKLRYLIFRCPQCKGKGSIPKREWHRVSEN